MFAKNLSFRGACVGLVGFVYLGFFWFWGFVCAGYSVQPMIVLWL